MSENVYGVKPVIGCVNVCLDGTTRYDECGGDDPCQYGQPLYTWETQCDDRWHPAGWLPAWACTWACNKGSASALWADGRCADRVGSALAADTAGALGGGGFVGDAPRVGEARPGGPGLESGASGGLEADSLSIRLRQAFGDLVAWLSREGPDGVFWRTSSGGWRLRGETLDRFDALGAAVTAACLGLASSRAREDAAALAVHALAAGIDREADIIERASGSVEDPDDYHAIESAAVSLRRLAALGGAR